MQSLFHSHTLATHLVDFHNNHQFVVFQIYLVSFSHDVCDLLDHAVARQNIVIAYRRPNCKLHGKKSQLPQPRISNTLICSPSSSWIRPGERVHTRYIPYAPGKVLDESAERELSTPPARDPRCWLDPSMSWVWVGVRIGFACGFCCSWHLSISSWLEKLARLGMLFWRRWLVTAVVSEHTSIFSLPL